MINYDMKILGPEPPSEDIELLAKHNLLWTNGEETLG